MPAWYTHLRHSSTVLGTITAQRFASSHYAPLSTRLPPIYVPLCLQLPPPCLIHPPFRPYPPDPELSLAEHACAHHAQIRRIVKGYRGKMCFRIGDSEARVTSVRLDTEVDIVNIDKEKNKQTPLDLPVTNFRYFLLHDYEDPAI